MGNLFNPQKFASGSLLDVDGNIYAVIAHFRKLARKSNWTQAEISKVTSAVMSSPSYEMALVTISSHMTGEDAAGSGSDSSVKSEEEIDALIEKAAQLLKKFEAESNTIDQDGDHSDKLMETLHGEMLLALSQLSHEFFNNSSFFYSNFNTVGNHAEFLRQVGTSEIKDLIHSTSENANFDESTYKQFLGRLAELILNFVETNTDTKNEFPKHWQIFEGRWDYQLNECCGEVTQGWDACSCADDDEDE